MANGLITAIIFYLKLKSALPPRRRDFRCAPTSCGECARYRGSIIQFESWTRTDACHGHNT